jgi:hypothetical protein
MSTQGGHNVNGFSHSELLVQLEEGVQIISDGCLVSQRLSALTATELIRSVP